MTLPLRWAPALLAALLWSGAAPAAAQQGAAPLHVGDRLLLKVEGEPTLSDTFTVRTGPVVDLPGIGPVSLSGVTRQNLEPHLTREIGRYLRNPVVHARALIWLGLVGEVARPGFYAVPADGLLSDALMAAGGVTRDAQLKKADIERNGAAVRNPGAIQDALGHGLTLEEIGIESGDQVLIPRKPDAERTTRIIGLILAVPIAVFAIAKTH